jgi:hypothetical protein
MRPTAGALERRTGRRGIGGRGRFPVDALAAPPPPADFVKHCDYWRYGQEVAAIKRLTERRHAFRASTAARITTARVTAPSLRRSLGHYRFAGPGYVSGGKIPFNRRTYVGLDVCRKRADCKRQH